MINHLYHLDPTALGAVLDLEPAAGRVLLALLALAPSGEMVGNEMRWATRAGLKGPVALREILAQLAATMGPSGMPIIARDTVRKQPRVRLNGLPDLFFHHLRQPVKTPHPAVAAEHDDLRRPPRVEMETIRESKWAALRKEYGDRLAELTEAWVGHLASLSSDGKLPLPLQIVQYDTVTDMAARFGPELALYALSAGISGVKKLDHHPEHYLSQVARRNFRSDNPQSAPPLASGPVRPKISRQPLRDEDLF